MIRKFLTNASFLLILNLLVKPFWMFGIDRTVQNQLGNEVYGEYFALLNFTFLFNILLDLGITNLNKVNISQNRQLLKKHTSGILQIKFVLGFCYIFMLVLAGGIIGYRADQMKLLLMLGCNQFLVSLILYLRSNIAGLHLFRLDNLISVLDRILMIAICSFLLWNRSISGNFNLEWFVYAQSSAYAITALIIFIVVLSRSGGLRMQGNYLFSIAIFKKSFPFAVLILLMTFYNRVDSVILERILPEGAVQAGIYAAAYRLFDAFNMISFLFASLLLPIFARMIKLKEEIDGLLKMAFALLLTATLVVSVVSWFYSEEIIGLMYTGNILESALVFRILMIATIPVSVTYVFGSLLTANRSLKQLNWLALGAMIGNITLNLIIIPYLFAFGAALASLVTQILMAIGQVILVFHLFKVRFSAGFYARILVFIFAGYLLGSLSTQLDFRWEVNIAICSLGCLIISIILKVFDIKGIFNALKNDK